MRSLRKNQQKLAYALYADEQPVYAKDGDGNVIYDEIDGEQVARVVDYRSGFDEPVVFYGSIAFAGGEAEATVYGVSIDAYDAKLVMPHGALPISETSLIFQTSEPQYDKSGSLKDSSADFRVARVADSLNETVYLLKRIVHNG